MSAAFTVRACAACDHAVYPPRILCPRCGGAAWKRRIADSGVVEELTVRRPVLKRRQLPWGNWLDQEATRLASIRTDAGPRIVARVPEGVEVGDRVTLSLQASTAIALPGQVVEAQADADENGRAPAARIGTPLSDWPGRD